MRRIALVLVGLVLSSAPALAGEKKEPKEKKTVVRFDGDTIDGDVVRPEGDLVAARPVVEMPSLVRAPSSFEREAARDLESAADAAGKLLRGGGGHGD